MRHEYKMIKVSSLVRVLCEDGTFTPSGHDFAVVHQMVDNGWRWIDTVQGSSHDVSNYAVFERLVEGDRKTLEG